MLGVLRCVVFAILLALALAGCDKPRVQVEAQPEPAEAAPPSTKAERPTAEAPAPAPAVTPPRPEPARPPTNAEPVELSVLAAPSVIGAVRAVTQLYSEQQGVIVNVREADSSEMLRALGDEPADVVITEGHTAIEVLRAAQVLSDDTLANLAYLPLTVTIAGKVVDQVRQLSDIDREGFRLGVADPMRSSGADAAARLLRRNDLGKKLSQRVLPTQTSSALKDGVVDAFIGWGRLDVGVPLTLSPGWQELLSVPGAATNITKNGREAAHYLAWLQTPATHAAWQRAGLVVNPDPAIDRLVTVIPARLPAPRRFAGAVVVDQRVLIVAGEAGGELLDTLVWYDPRRVSLYNATARLPEALQGAAVANLASEKRVFVAGGLTAAGPTSRIVRFDPTRDHVDDLEVSLPLPMGRGGSALVGDTLYVFGGRGSSETLLDAIVRVNLASGEALRLKLALSKPTADLAAHLTGSGKILLIGGENKRGPSDAILVFDPTTRALTEWKHRLPRPLSAAQVFRWNNGFLVVGGSSYKGPRDTVEHIAEDGTLTRMPWRLPYPLLGASAIIAHNKLYLLGGLSHDRVERRILRLPY